MFLLASSSSYRLKQLNQLGIFPESCSPNIDESVRSEDGPKTLAERLAIEKAQTVANDQTNPSLRYIIGADQVAAVNDEILGKPVTRERAMTQLTTCSGKQVTFFTAVCLIDLSHHRTLIHCDLTKVTFRSLKNKEIERYIEIESPLDCAGSFKCEGLGISLFKAIETHDPSALIGLPLIGLTSMLLQTGYNPITQPNS